MVSTEEVYTPVQSSGCLWAATKLLIIFAVVIIFGLGFLAGFFLMALSSFLL